MGDFAERVGLVHELAELRAAKEFAYRGHNRLGVDQIVRHGRRHFLVHAHLFLDGAFHADQADAELVFEQFANGANAAITEVVDVVDNSDVLAQLEQVLDGRHKIRRVECAIVQRRIHPHLDVELQTADAAEIILTRIKEHSAEKIRSRFKRRRIARTQLAVNFDQRFFGRTDAVLVERAREHQPDVVALRKEHVDFSDARFGKRLPHIRRDRLIGFEQDFAGLAIDHVGDAVRAFEVRQRRANLRNLGLDQLFEKVFGDALVRADKHFFCARVLDLVRELAVHDSRRHIPEQVFVAQGNALHLVESAQNVFIGLHAQRAQENRAEEFALAIDTHVENVLGVVLELHPGAAVRNNLPKEVAAIVGALEKHARRTVQLADDYALGAVDDERAVLGHQRNIAVENFLLFNVANGFRAAVRIFVVNGQTNGDL